MAFPAFLDTNVLYGAVLADTLLRIAEAGAYRPHWSADVLDELSRNLVRRAAISLARPAIGSRKWTRLSPMRA